MDRLTNMVTSEAEFQWRTHLRTLPWIQSHIEKTIPTIATGTTDHPAGAASIQLSLLSPADVRTLWERNDCPLAKFAPLFPDDPTHTRRDRYSYSLTPSLNDTSVMVQFESIGETSRLASISSSLRAKWLGQSSPTNFVDLQQQYNNDLEERRQDGGLEFDIGIDWAKFFSTDQWKVSSAPPIVSTWSQPCTAITELSSGPNGTLINHSTSAGIGSDGLYNTTLEKLSAIRPMGFVVPFHHINIRSLVILDDYYQSSFDLRLDSTLGWMKRLVMTAGGTNTESSMQWAILTTTIQRCGLGLDVDWHTSLLEQLVRKRPPAIVLPSIVWPFRQESYTCSLPTPLVLGYCVAALIHMPRTIVNRSTVPSVSGVEALLTQLIVSALTDASLPTTSTTSYTMADLDVLVKQLLIVRTYGSRWTISEFYGKFWYQLALDMFHSTQCVVPHRSNSPEFKTNLDIPKSVQQSTSSLSASEIMSVQYRLLHWIGWMDQPPQRLRDTLLQARHANSVNSSESECSTRWTELCAVMSWDPAAGLPLPLLMDIQWDPNMLYWMGPVTDILATIDSIHCRWQYWNPRIRSSRCVRHVKWFHRLTYSRLAMWSTLQLSRSKRPVVPYDSSTPTTLESFSYTLPDSFLLHGALGTIYCPKVRFDETLSYQTRRGPDDRKVYLSHRLGMHNATVVAENHTIGTHDREYVSITMDPLPCVRFVLDDKDDGVNTDIDDEDAVTSTIDPIDLQVALRDMTIDDPDTFVMMRSTDIGGVVKRNTSGASSNRRSSKTKSAREDEGAPPKPVPEPYRLAALARIRHHLLHAGIPIHSLDPSKPSMAARVVLRPTTDLHPPNSSILSTSPLYRSTNSWMEYGGTTYVRRSSLMMTTSIESAAKEYKSQWDDCHSPYVRGVRPESLVTRHYRNDPVDDSVLPPARTVMVLEREWDDRIVYEFGIATPDSGLHPIWTIRPWSEARILTREFTVLPDLITPPEASVSSSSSSSSASSLSTTTVNDRLLALRNGLTPSWEHAIPLSMLGRLWSEGDRDDCVRATAKSWWGTVLTRSPVPLLRRLLHTMTTKKKSVVMPEPSMTVSSNSYRGCTELDFSLYPILIRISIMYPSSLSWDMRWTFTIRYRPLWWTLTDQLQRAIQVRVSTALSQTLSSLKHPTTSASASASSSSSSLGESLQQQWTSRVTPPGRVLWDNQCRVLSALMDKCAQGATSFPIWASSGSGKTAIVIEFLLHHLQQMDLLPRYMVWATTTEAIKSTADELERYSIPYSVWCSKTSKLATLMDSDHRAQSAIPYRVMLVSHEYLRMIADELLTISSDMTIILDELDKLYNKRNTRGQLSRILHQHCALRILMTGSPFDKNQTDMLEWTDSRVPIDRDRNFFAVVASTLIAERDDTCGIATINRKMIVSPLNDEERKALNDLKDGEVSGNAIPKIGQARHVIAESACDRAMIEWIHSRTSESDCKGVVGIVRDVRHMAYLRNSLLKLPSWNSSHIVAVDGVAQTAINLTADNRETDHPDCKCLLVCDRKSQGFNADRFHDLCRQPYTNQLARIYQQDHRIIRTTQQSKVVNIVTFVDASGILEQNLKDLDQRAYESDTMKLALQLQH